jgi:16S rRNA (uracil1498-N3)-methyltransferase
MRLHRFYINEKIVKEIRINDEKLLHQWLKVFRFKTSDRIIVFNGGDSEYEGYFKILSKDEAVLVIDKERKIEKPTDIELHLFQSIIKKDNFELIVEKCTEIGASAFHPIISERSEKKNLNIERLNKIAKEASEQSGKTTLPKIFEPEDLKKAISDFDGELFTLDFDGEYLKDIFSSDKNKKIGILIGPEGGWTENEKDFFEDRKIRSISLGSQILRAETAVISVSALILLK